MVQTIDCMTLRSTNLRFLQQFILPCFPVPKNKRVVVAVGLHSTRRDTGDRETWQNKCSM